MLTRVANTDLANRIVTDHVSLAINDTADNWREIPIAEAEAIKAQQEAMINEAISQHIVEG